MDNRFGLVVRFVLTEGHEQAFDALVRELIPAVREHEPRTLVFAVHTVDGRPDLRIFYEMYTDRAAFDAHDEQPHIRKFAAARDEHTAGVEVDFLELIDGTGV